MLMAINQIIIMPTLAILQGYQVVEFEDTLLLLDPIVSPETNIGVHGHGRLGRRHRLVRLRRAGKL